MDKTLKIYLSVLLGVIVLIVIIDSARTKPTNWSQTFSLDEKRPMDLYVFNREVEKIFPENRMKRVMVTPYEYLSENEDSASFLIINPNVYDQIDSLLLDRVSKGSNLWISAENFVRFLTDTIHSSYSDADPNINLQLIDSVKLTLSMSDWRQKHFYLSHINNLYAFDELDSSTTTILGSMEVHKGKMYPNYIRVKFGKGSIFLHNQPEVFTNFALLESNSSADYVAHILSYIPDDKPVVWFVKDQTINRDVPVNQSALSVVFRYPALRMTWLLFIYGMFLYLLFNAKRRQRIVPVIKPLKNTTVEFIQTIGNLYFQEGDDMNIVEKKIIYFLDRIRQKYFLDTSKLDDSFIEKLQSKSGKDKELITSIIMHINYFEKNKNATRNDLINLNKRMEEFWK